MTPARIVLAALFMIAGSIHFIAPGTYLRIMPPWLPAPLLLVYVSGACEFLGGLGLLLPGTRRFAAWGLIALLIAVMPANFQMVLDHGSKWRNIPLWLLWARLPLQLPLLWWAWLYARA